MRPPKLLVAAALPALVALAGCSETSHRAAAADQVVTVSVTSCGSGWTAHSAGLQSFAWHNTDTQAGEVQLVNPDTGAVFVDIEPLGPGTTDRMSVTLGPGRYAVRCLMEDDDAVTGPVVTLHGGPVPNAAPGVIAFTQAQLDGASKKYQAYVRDRLPRLAGLVARLRRHLADRARARRDWLAAHLEYERLGAAYDAFGDLDQAINGLPVGLPRGIHDPRWTGFHRIEYGLWHGESTAVIRPLVDTLATDVTRLERRFRQVQIDPLTLTTRAHEIVENALQFSLTGEDDYGSNSGLATVRANLDGTTAVLRLLAPVLRRQHTNVQPIDAGIAHAESLLDAQDHDGTWTPLPRLSRTDREQLDAAISELAELLSPIATRLEPRRTS